MITKRRICWPDPDATCLQGGCFYCNYHPFRAISTIRRWAEKAGKVRNRGNREEVDAAYAFATGLRNDFFNAEVK